VSSLVLGCNKGGGGGNFSKVERLVRKCSGTRKRLFSAVSCFSSTRVGFQKRRNFFPGLILTIKASIYICPCSRAVGTCKKIWIQKYFGPVTVDSMEIFRHLAFWRHGTRLASFLLHQRTAFFEAHLLSS